MATVPTVKELLLKLSPELLDIVCWEEHLLKLTKQFGKWIPLADYLGLTDVQQKEIENAWPRDPGKQRMQMFSKWMNNMGNKATYRYSAYYECVYACACVGLDSIFIYGRSPKL